MAVGPMLATVVLMMLAATTAGQQPEPTPRQLCGPGVQPPSNRFNSTERLRLLRAKMKEASVGADWYLQTAYNRVLSAPQPREKYLVWISGFTGSSGQVLVTDTAAYLFTDTRYTLQADQELDCHWQFYDSVSLPLWVATYNGSAVRLAVDARQIRAVEYQSLNNPSVTLVPLDTNPVDELWTSDRPDTVVQAVYPLEQKYAGKTWQAKVAQVRQAMARRGADFLVVAGLDETAYLLNLRATVLAYVPYFPSLVLLSASSQVYLLLDDPSSFLNNETLRQYLGLAADGSCQSGVEMCPSLRRLSDLAELAKQTLTNGSKVWLDTAACSYAVMAAFRANASLLPGATPVMLAKAVKNSAEQAAFTSCSLADSAALVAFLARLQGLMQAGESVTELSASSLLASYRAKLADFRGLSFETIAASGPNAAVIHYRPSEATNRPVGGSDVFLLDSGGQYLGCTTDVTRTLYYGPPAEPPAEVVDAYTRVLMGVIDLFNLTWPSHLHSRNVDPLARRNLWAVRKDYRHGTGHGIGLFLGVHEGPNGIGRDLALVEGNYQSIEPGFYQAEAPSVRGFGIRLETITGVKLTGEYLRFQPVTWVPFERRLINTEMLSVDQLRWLNWYHAECRLRLPAALKDIGEEANAAAWLTAATEPIGHDVKAAVGLSAPPVQLLAVAVSVLCWLVLGSSH